LHCYFWPNPKIGWSFHVYHEAISILYRWCSLCRISFIILLSHALLQKSFICRRSFHHGPLIFLRMRFHSDQISRLGVGKYSNIYNCIPMYIRLRILDLCIWNYTKWFSYGSLSLCINVVLDFTKYDNTINSIKWHGGQWFIYDARIYSNNCFHSFGCHS
jgi:hypothetical protein